MTDSTGTDNVSRQQIALTNLRTSRETILFERRMQIDWVWMARGCGVTFKVIGDALGVTEGAVRAMLARDQ